MSARVTAIGQAIMVALISAGTKSINAPSVPTRKSPVEGVAVTARIYQYLLLRSISYRRALNKP